MKFLPKHLIQKQSIRARKHGHHNCLRRRFHKKKIVRKFVEIRAPGVFSLARNYDATVSCLHKLKKAALLQPPKNIRKSVAIDLATIEELSAASALVLAAEIDRWQRVKKVPLRPHNTRKWSLDVKRLLIEIGFFDLLDVDPPFVPESPLPNKDVTILPLVTGKILDAKKFAEIEDHLRRVAHAFKQEPSIYTALIEAAYNSIKHGYPAGHDFRFPTFKDQWWATGSWSPERSEVTLVIYDQGVGIAETLPTSHLWEDLTKRLSSKYPVFSKVVKEHANMIEAALEVSRTSLTSGHGQGLRDVVSPVDQLGSGRVRILSGKGQVLYKNGGNLDKIEHPQHLGGTLIEWTIPVS